MPEWLKPSFDSDLDLTLSVLALRMAVALVLGCVVAGIYRLALGKPGSTSLGLTATLVLLTVLIGMVTLVIGNSVARAFGLVGALSIVRFRTVVEDTRDTAFVIFAVAVGMAVGSGYLMVPLVGIPFAALAAFLFSPRAAESRSSHLDFTLTVRIGTGHPAEVLLREAFGKHLESAQLTAMVTARQGVAFDRTYAVRLRQHEDAAALVIELNGVAGVQNVELRQA